MNKLRQANLDDLDDVEMMIESAKKLLKSENLSQWQSGTPNRNSLKQDILNKTCFILEVDGGVAGTVNLSTKPDPNYANIDGMWQFENAPYVTIHRIAVHPFYRNERIGQKLLDQSIEWTLSQKINQIRVDTHRHNYRMIYLLQKYQFEFAGVVDVVDPIDSKRNAYQVFLEPS